MNKYIRGLFVIPSGIVKTVFLKLFHPKSFKGVQPAQISPRTEITIEKGSLSIGKGFKMRDGSKIRVRKNATLKIGNDVSISSWCIIACRDSIEIDDGVEISPNVLIYDHDHDVSAEGGLHGNKYKTAPVKIGKNVWIGANTIILRGTVVGDNAVIGAGSVIKGVVEANSVVIQRRRWHD